MIAKQTAHFAATLKLSCFHMILCISCSPQTGQEKRTDAEQRRDGGEYTNNHRSHPQAYIDKQKIKRIMTSKHPICTHN